MLTKYKNTFYRKGGESPETIETEANPTEYKGYLIYERIRKVCFDIVTDGVCIGMYAGINGAKKRIDKEKSTVYPKSGSILNQM